MTEAVVAIRLTKDELELVETAAEFYDFKLTDWIKKQALTASGYPRFKPVTGSS